MQQAREADVRCGHACGVNPLQQAAAETAADAPQGYWWITSTGLRRPSLADDLARLAHFVPSVLPA